MGIPIRIQEGDKFSKGVMVLLAVSKCGIGRLIFPPEGVKICGDTYLQLMRKEVVPDIRSKMVSRADPAKWWWQQDLAPAHEKKEAKAAIGKIVPKFLPWTPKGADLSPLDYSVWGWMDAKLS